MKTMERAKWIRGARVAVLGVALVQAPALAADQQALGRNAEGAKQKGAIPYKEAIPTKMGDAKGIGPAAGADAAKLLVPADKLKLAPSATTAIREAKQMGGADALKEPKVGKGDHGDPKGIHPASGEGQQKGALKVTLSKAARTDLAQRHLQLVIKVKEDGSAEVLRAVHVPGPARERTEVVGNHVAEVLRGSEPVAFKSLEDPFLLRGLADPKNPAAGHSFVRVSEAVIQIEVPDMDPASLPPDLNFRVSRLEPDAGPVDRLDKAKLKLLAPKLKLVARIGAEKLVPEAKSKALKLSPSDVAPGAGVIKPLTIRPGFEKLDLKKR